MTGRPRSVRRLLGARGLLLAVALVGCGVKAPPKPPAQAGAAGSRHDAGPAEPADGGGGATGPADGGAGRP